MKAKIGHKQHGIFCGQTQRKNFPCSKLGPHHENNGRSV